MVKYMMTKLYMKGDVFVMWSVSLLVIIDTLHGAFDAFELLIFVRNMTVLWMLALGFGRTLAFDSAG